MKSYELLLEANKEWAKQQALDDPTFFKKMAEGQNPEFLWIGCADSRAPADKITQTNPGQIFVHRNVANLVIDTDINMLSVLQYAVEVLKVKHVMVVGHYGCGGVKAALGKDDMGIINKWVRHIKDVYQLYENDLKDLDEDTKFKKLCELNVVEQVKNLIKTSIIQKSWKNSEAPHIHGWILELSTGHINQLIEVEAGDYSHTPPIYQYDIK